MSGIGCGQVLKNAGVELKRENKAVGMNLHDHLQIRPVFRVNTETVNQMYHS
jgi:choline dehydrogenase